MTDELSDPPDDLNVSFTHEGFSCTTSSRTPGGWSLTTAVFSIAALLALPVVIPFGWMALAPFAAGTSAGIFALRLRDFKKPRYRRFKLDCQGASLAINEAEKPVLELNLQEIEGIQPSPGAVLITHDGTVTRVPEVGHLGDRKVLWLAAALNARVPKKLEPGSDEEREHRARQKALRALMNRTTGD